MTTNADQHFTDDSAIRSRAARFYNQIPEYAGMSYEEIRSSHASYTYYGDCAGRYLQNTIEAGLLDAYLCSMAKFNSMNDYHWERGRTSNIPDCCIEHWITSRDNETYKYAPDSAEPGYIRCPDCKASGNVAIIHECYPECFPCAQCGM